MIPAILAACATPASPDGSNATASRDPEALALVEAPPSDWPRRMSPVLALGSDAGAGVLSALRQRPDAPGAPAAVAVIGSLGHMPARPWLEDQVERRTPLGVEAALALGSLPSPESIPVLQRTAGDPASDATLRAACAAAMVELGAGNEVVPLIRALVLAGSPGGRAIAAEVGLPDKPRWAMERYLVLRALRRAAPDVDFELDTDSPWPDLERSAKTIGRWLASR